MYSQEPEVASFWASSIEEASVEAARSAPSGFSTVASSFEPLTFTHFSFFSAPPLVSTSLSSTSASDPSVVGEESLELSLVSGEDDGDEASDLDAGSESLVFFALRRSEMGVLNENVRTEEHSQAFN
jgi:hypothetical protein